MGTVPSHDADGKPIPQPVKETPKTKTGNPDDEFPSDGIRLSYLSEFIDKVCGGRDKIKDLTTTQICEQFVKPNTHPDKQPDKKGVSYVELLKRQDESNEAQKKSQQSADKFDQAPIAKIVGKAQVFMSHAWSYKFVDVVDAMVDHFRDKPDIYIWFDNFTVNQHNTDEKKFDWWSTTFKDAIQDFGHTVMVLSPWKSPIPLTRAWCLWELYCASTTNSKFEVVMSQKEQDDFFKELSIDPDVPIDRMLSAIDVKNAQAWKQTDLESIFEAVARISGDYNGENKDEKQKGKDKGCEILNAVVFRRMREWVIEISEKRLATRRFTAGQRLEDKLVLGSLYHNHGRYEKAEPILIECTEYFRRSEYNPAYGENHFNRYVAMTYLGSLHGKKNRHNKAEPLLKDSLKRKLDLRQPDNCQHLAHIVKGYYELGRYYEMRLIFPLAWENYHLGIKACDEGLTKFSQEFPQEHLLAGMNHLNRLTIVDPPTDILSTWGDFETQILTDFTHIRDIINRIKDTMINQINPSATNTDRKMGDNHQIIVHAQTNKARMYFLKTKQDTHRTPENYNEAAKEFFEAIKRAKEVLGDRHPETVKLLRIMSKFFRDMEEYYKSKGDSENEILYQQYSNFYYLDYRSKI